MPEPIVALEIGSTKVACLAGFPGKNGDLQVLAYATAPSRGVHRGGIVDIEETGRSVDAAIRRLQSDLGQPFERVYVAIGGPQVEGQNSQGMKPIVPRTRHVTHHDVLEVIKHSRAIGLEPDREQVQAIPRGFKVDGQAGIQHPVGMPGGRLEVDTYIVTAPRTAVQNLERVSSLGGKVLDQVVYAPLAAGLGVLTSTEIASGVAVVDIGGGTTDLAVFVDGSLAYSVSLPIGSGLVTRDIATLLKTAPEEAERLKLQFGAAMAKSVSDRETVEVSQIGQIQARPMQRRVLCEIIESRMREIAVMVRQHLERSGYLGLLPSGIVLTGGGSQLAATDHLFEENIPGTSVRVGTLSGGKVRLDAGAAVVLGIAQFAVQCYDEIEPVSGEASWRERARSLFSFWGGK